MRSLFYFIGSIAAIVGVAFTLHLLTCKAHAQQLAEPDIALKDAFKGKFKFGMAMTDEQILGKDTLGLRLNARHSNTIVGGNAFKLGVIQPTASSPYRWDMADSVVAFAERNGMELTGHVLIWHPNLEKRFKPLPGGGYEGDAESFKQWMHDYITTVVSRYKGKVAIWEVVNEAILEDGSYRMSPAYYFLGEEFIPLAFQYAHEADPDAKLYINDYAMWESAKRATYLRIAKGLKKRHLPLYAIGMQCHIELDNPHPSTKELDKAIKELAKPTGRVMITELDMNALPRIYGSELRDSTKSALVEQKRDPFPDGLDDSRTQRWNTRMGEVLDVLLKNHKKIESVKTWGVTDQYSWRNSYPIPDRTDYPLWFDRKGHMKPFLVNALNRKR